MYAVVIDDGRLCWQPAEDPHSNHELLVAVRAAGVNSADTGATCGTLPRRRPDGHRHPQLEMAGEVVSRWAAGDSVQRLATASWRSSAAAPRPRSPQSTRRMHYPGPRPVAMA